MSSLNSDCSFLLWHLMKKIILLFLLFNFVFSQNSSLSGYVKDQTNGDPLLGANVVLSGTTMGAATGMDGSYNITNIKAGDYKILVTYIGFETLEFNLTIPYNESIQQDFNLSPEAIQMETYVVTASRRRERVEDAPAAISVITKKDIRRESNTNLGDYLKGTKGIDFTQSGIDSYNMTARGFNSSFSSRLLTLTDGRMANVPSLRLTAYNVIPVSFEDVEQIEVVLGPSSALYGPNAHSGVLNIVTSSPLRTQGTSINIQGGFLNQADTDLLQKLTFRTAHKYKDFGFKISGVALRGQDWTHYNADELEGHDPAFIGRPNLKHNFIDNGGNPGEGNSPLFTEDMLGYFDDANESWIGKTFGDNIASFSSETGSPIITEDMVAEAQSDPFNRYFLDNGIILWYVTEDKIGSQYADGIDNNGDGAIDEGIDLGIDDDSEIWYDNVDNDGDGLVDEADEIGSAWLDRFGSTFEGDLNYTVGVGVDSTHKFGFGDYEYDDDGNIIFDTNGNGEFNDSWGSDGLDNDGDWDLYVDTDGMTYGVEEETFSDLNENGTLDGKELFIDGNGNGTWEDGEVLIDWGLDGVDGTGDFGEGNGTWDGETFTDLNGNGTWDQFENNDLDGDGKPSMGEVGVDEFDEKDFVMNYGDLPRIYKDANDDGLNDYPDFNVRNYRYDLRFDWEPNPDFTLSLSHGYAWARNINITGIARYLADGWVYRYYQGKIRWKNFFLQTYLNSSYSGESDHPTRNLATGSLIYDRSKKFSAQFQHAMELLNGDLRFVWGVDYFLTMPNTRGTILSDKELVDRKDNNGTGEAGSPYTFADRNDNTFYDDGEFYSTWATDTPGAFGGTPSDTLSVNNDGSVTYSDNVFHALADGFDNDGDSDDFEDLNGNGLPDFDDADGDGLYSYGETVEPGVKWIGENIFFVYSDGIDNDGDGKIDENIDEGIDEASEDNRYTVNELGAYYQVNWKLNDKLEIIQATRLDIHDRLTNLIEFNNQGYGMGYNPLDWEFDASQKNGLQFSPKIGFSYKPKENQNFRLTWATAFNTPTNQALFLDIFVTRVSIFKVYARGADGGYNFPRNELGNPYYYDIEEFEYMPVDTSESMFFYPSVDPRIEGFYGQTVIDLPEIEAEIVNSWEVGYKGRLNNRLFGTLDLYTSHYSSFVSPVTFITPIVLERSILETDYNNDGVMNTIEDFNNDIILDQDDYDKSFDHWRDGIQGVTAMDTIAGLAPPVVVGYINYGEVDMWGMDASLTWFINREWNLDVTYSHLSMTEFFNPITKAKDPINAPKHKGSLKLQYAPRRWPVSTSLNARYVDGYNWSSGIYFGKIDPYTILDLHVGYTFNDNLSGNLTVNNLLDNRHTEIIGGPSLGRVVVFRLSTKL